MMKYSSILLRIKSITKPLPLLHTIHSSMNLPIIDISPWISGDCNSIERKTVAECWNNALRDYGFAVIVGHQINEAIFDEVNEESLKFFAHSNSSKMTYSRGGYGHPLGGYTPAGRENVENSFADVSQAASNVKKAADPVENFVFTSAPSGFTAADGCSPSPIPSADDYYTRMSNLLSLIHSISCAALSLPDINFFSNFYDASIAGNELKGKNGNCLRLANYFPQSVPLTQVTKEDIRYGAHTDFQGFTILRPDKSDWHSQIMSIAGREYQVTCGGLEVFNRTSNEWIPVKIPKHLNALVINAGDLIQRWTNDYWLSPIHRVVSKPSIVPLDGRPLKEEKDDTSSDHSLKENVVIEVPGRQAIVYFSGPLEEAVVEVLPLPHILQHRGGAVYPPVRSGDWLQMKLNQINT